MTPKYAAKTEVSEVRSQQELTQLLVKYGASDYGLIQSSSGQVLIEAIVKNRRIRFVLPPPSAEATQGLWGRKAELAREQWGRQRWRVLILVLKAKFEAIETGLTTVEQEFMANLVLPNGQTMSDSVLPQLDSLGPAGPMLALGPGGAA